MLRTGSLVGWSAWLVVVSACTQVPRSGAGPVPDPLEPGVVVSAFNETGGMKWLDLPALEGALLALEEVNQAGGVLGRPVELVRVDGITDATNLARRLAGELGVRDDVGAAVGITEGVFALAPRRGALRRADGGFSNYSHSSQLDAVAPVTEGAGIPLLSVGSTRPELSRSGERVFSVAGPTDRKAAALADFARGELGAERVWMLIDGSYDYTRTAAASFRDGWEEAGGQVVGEVTYEGGVTGLLGGLEDLLPLEAPPEAVFLGALPGDGGLLLRGIREAGFAGPGLAADWFDTPYVAAYAGDLADGLYYSTDLCLCHPGEGMRRFLEGYEQAAGEPPPHSMAALGYEAVWLLADALERAGSTEAGPLSATSGFRSPAGLLGFQGEREVSRMVSIVEVDGGEHRLAAGWGDQG